MESSKLGAAEQAPPSSHATFMSQWDVQSPRRLFGNPHRKPHAWDRHPVQRAAILDSSDAAVKKPYTVWKRCDVLSGKTQQRLGVNLDDESKENFQPIGLDGPVAIQSPDGKVVKRRRLSLEGTSVASRKLHEVAKRDRRWSGLPHKMTGLKRIGKDLNMDNYYFSVPSDEKNEEQNLEGMLEADFETPGSMNDTRENQRLSATRSSESDLGTVFELTEIPSATLVAGLPQEDRVTRDHPSQVTLARNWFSDVEKLEDQETECKSDENAFIEPAAFQHLEHVRLELTSKSPSRRRRRKTDFIASKSVNSQISKKRRVSAAVNAFRIEKPDSPSQSHDHYISKRFSLVEAKLSSEQVPAQPDDSIITPKNATEGDEVCRSESTTEEVMRNLEEKQNSSIFTVEEKVPNEEEEHVLPQFGPTETLTTDHEATEENSVDCNVEEILEEIVETAVAAVTDTSPIHADITGDNDRGIAGDTYRNTSMEADTENLVEQQSVTEMSAPSGALIDNESITTTFEPVKISPKLFGRLLQVDERVTECLTDENGGPGTPNSFVMDCMQELAPETIDPLMNDIIELEEDSMHPTVQKTEPEIMEPDIRNEHFNDTVTENDGEVETSPAGLKVVETTRKVSLNDDDTNILKDFLTRARASKAAKIADQSAILNRRDSDVVKYALASPRKALEDLDANSPSPKKPRIEDNTTMIERPKEDLLLSEAEPLLKASEEECFGDPDELTDSSALVRRSSRMTNSANNSTKRPANSAPTPNEISLRRQDTSDTVVLKRTKAQELAMLTRTNTRRNKGVPVKGMLLKLKGLPVDELPETESTSVSEGRVRWNENLVAVFDESEDNRPQRAVETIHQTAAASRPRARRAKMLGAMNGTPAKPIQKEMEQVLVEGENTMEIDTVPVNTPEPRSVKEAQKGTRQTASSQDDPQLLAAATKQSAPKAVGRTAKRIPTPAKPAKAERLATAAPEGFSTRPSRVQRAVVKTSEKENEAMGSSKDRGSARSVVQTRSASGGATGPAAEAPRRSKVPRKEGIKDTRTGRFHE